MKPAAALIFVSCVLFSCQSANSQHPSVKYEEKKASLKEMEEDSPLKFLKVTGSFRNNLVNQAVVEGEVNNKSTLASYKNVKLSITFLDESGKVLEKDKDVLDEVIEPASTTNFKYKTSHVKGASTIAVDITDADAVAEK